MICLTDLLSLYTSAPTISFPEIDKAAWFDINEAKKEIIEAQLSLINELEIIKDIKKWITNNSRTKKLSGSMRKQHVYAIGAGNVNWNIF